MQLSDLLDEIPLDDGDVIPLALRKLLREELNVCDDWQRAERLLLEAREQLPERLEIPVALYKMYAYSNRHEESLALIHEVLEQAPELNDRLYLYSLKAKGFVLLRMGKVDEAAAVLQQLQTLDPLDQVGGSVVMQMAERLLEQDEEYA